MDPTCGLADKLLEFVLDQIWEHLLYLIYYHKNTERLNQGLEELADKRSSTQHRIDEARNNVEEIEKQVLHWLLKVDEISERAQKFHEEASQAKTVCSLTSCPNPCLRYKLSKRAKAMAQQVADICGNTNFDTVSYRVPPQSSPATPNGESNEGIDSRGLIMNQIMETLRNPSLNMIGLCGPAGVGKTTIAKEVEMKEKNQEMFEKVIWATVSDELNITKIQRQIAKKLGMSLNKETENIRACRLWKRLEQEKNMLLILDDLWEELDLGKVGIPIADVKKYSKKNEDTSEDIKDGKINEDSKRNEGFKILLTSRNEALLSNNMKCQKIIQVGVLLEDEAWELFKRIAKLSIDSSSPELISIATEIVRKCGGLLLAISTAAKALRKKDLNEWKDALLRLKRLGRNIIGIKEMDTVLRLSYDHLSSEKKDIFLLSAMLSHDLLIEDLLMYSVGLDILKHVEDMEEAHDGISTVVSKLKSLNFFLDTFSSHYITMHDVFRDVALVIASNELPAFIVRHRKLNEWPEENELEACKAICLQESDIIGNFPEELVAWSEIRILSAKQHKKYWFDLTQYVFQIIKGVKSVDFCQYVYSVTSITQFLAKTKSIVSTLLFSRRYNRI